jgi:hypothetical protein
MSPKDSDRRGKEFPKDSDRRGRRKGKTIKGKTIKDKTKAGPSHQPLTINH